VTDLDGRGPQVDDETLAEEIAALLDGRTVATAESVTAGRVAERLACAEGAVEFLRGGLVAYQETTKRAMLDVTAPKVVSGRAAAEMADGAARLFGVDVAVSTTGLAGSAPQDGVPGGTVFVATSVNGDMKVWEHHFQGRPLETCDRASRAALIDLRQHLEAHISGGSVEPGDGIATGATGATGNDPRRDVQGAIDAGGRSLGSNGTDQLVEGPNSL